MPIEKEIPFDQFIALDDEVRASINLIQTGLAELQNIDDGNDFYYLPFILLSNGLEKLLKVIICFYFWEQKGHFPTMNDFKEKKNDNGHNLLYLKNKVLSEYFIANTPAIKEDLEILSNNETLNKLIYFLGEFGQYSRFYNLDVIISNPKKKSKDIKRLWEKLETDLLLADSELFNQLKKNLKNIDKEKVENIRKINEQVQKKTIILLEIFARALTRQFAFGNLGQAKRFTGTIMPFLTLMDNELGKRDYRKMENK
jgi:hypothetical protein